MITRFSFQMMRKVRQVGWGRVGKDREGKDGLG